MFGQWSVRRGRTSIFSEVLIAKGFKSNVFGSVHSKGVAAPFSEVRILKDLRAVFYHRIYLHMSKKSSRPGADEMGTACGGAYGSLPRAY